MSIRLKFNLVILLVFVVGFVLAGYLVRGILIESAKHEVELNARIMMAAAKSARTYTVQQVRPLLRQIDTEEFLPQTVPAYSATESMKLLQKTLPDYTYKEAVLNPTNPEHRASDWEQDVISYFRTYDSSEYTGVRDTPTGQYLFLGQPFKITNANCLACHSTPEAAPPAMVKRYGSNNGFGWKHNEIVGAQLVNVPMSIPLQRADEAFKTFMLVLGGVFIAIWLMLNLMLDFFILRRIRSIRENAEKISKGDMSVPEFEISGKDEVSSLGQSFNLMYRSLVSAVKLLDKTQMR